MATTSPQTPKSAVLHRMVLPDHVCPFGVASLELLRRQGLRVEDRQLTTREETDALKHKLGVSTTPQTFIDGERVGGYDELCHHFGVTDQ